MFENTAIRIIAALIVIVLGVMLLKFLKPAEKSSFTEYKPPANAKKSKKSRGILKGGKSVQTEQKTVTWAPSPVDATIDEYGSWDTNRNPPNFITNVAKHFPGDSEGTVSRNQAAWDSAQMFAPPVPSVPSVPDVSMTSEFGSMNLPPVGAEDPFMADFSEI